MSKGPWVIAWPGGPRQLASNPVGPAGRDEALGASSEEGVADCCGLGTNREGGGWPPRTPGDSVGLVALFLPMRAQAIGRGVED